MKIKIILLISVVLIVGILIGSLIVLSNFSEQDSENGSENGTEQKCSEGMPVVFSPVQKFVNISIIEAATPDHHSGIHFKTNSTIIIYACFDGKIEGISYNHTTGYDGKISNGFSIHLLYNEEYWAIYRIEFFHTDGYLSEDYIRSNVYVELNQWVKKGDALGKLVNFSYDSHLCWSVWHMIGDPSNIEDPVNYSWCMFSSMAPGLAEDLNNFYKTHSPPWTQENICWCWNNHTH